MNDILSPFSRHSGLDPLSPMQKGHPFPLRRLRVCARNDGYGLELVILVLEIQVSLTLLDALDAALQLV